MNITDTMTAAAAAVSRFAQTLRGAGYRAKRSPRARWRHVPGPMHRNLKAWRPRCPICRHDVTVYATHCGRCDARFPLPTVRLAGAR